MAKQEHDKAIGKADKKAPAELSNDDLDRVVGGTGGGYYFIPADVKKPPIKP